MRKVLVLLLVAGAVAMASARASPPPASAQEPEVAGGLGSPMAGKLILYGDLAFFQGRDGTENCVLKSRYRPGEAVGFRMTAIEPLTGQYADTAELTVHLTYGGVTEAIPMRFRGVGDNPHPGMWTAKWVVPADAPVGIVTYRVIGVDQEGRTGEFKPFDVEASQLTIAR